MTRGKRVAVPLLALVLLTPHATAAPTATPGAKCSKIGKTTTASKKQLICVRVGSVLRWKLRSTTAKPTPPPNAATPVPTEQVPIYPQDDVTVALQRLLDGMQVSDQRSRISINVIAESDKDGPYQAALVDSLRAAVDFYGSIGFLTNVSRIDLIIGRSETWINTQSQATCPLTYMLLTSSDSSPCRSRNSIVIRSNLARIVTGQPSFVDAATDLSGYVVKPELLGRTCSPAPCVTQSRWLNVLSQLPHELFHAYQFSYANSMSTLPPWLVEGSAVVMQQLATAKTIRPQTSYAKYLAEFMPHLKGGPDAAKCSSSFQAMSTAVGSGCQYTQGAHAVEILIANHGGLETLGRLIREPKGSNFQADFETITGIAWDKFVREVDAHSRNFGFAQLSA